MRQTYEVIYNPNLNLEESEMIKIAVEEVGECPLCHVATSPTFINGYLIGSKDNSIPLTAFIILYCPRCKNLYIAKYIFINGLTDLYPYYFIRKEFSDNIKNLSPEFVNIYSQSLEAESNNATKGLAGLGYRKSLEFLVKDYLIKLKHQDKNTIINMKLNDCIKKLDSDLQDIAKASVWIGNDEVHYFRKNEDYNIQDMKEFVDYLLFEIERYYVRIKAKNLVKKQ